MTSMQLDKIRDDRTLAYAVPLIAFMVVGGGLQLVTGSMLGGIFRGVSVGFESGE